MVGTLGCQLKVTDPNGRVTNTQLTPTGVSLTPNQLAAFVKLTADRPLRHRGPYLTPHAGVGVRSPTPHPLQTPNSLKTDPECLTGPLLREQPFRQEIYSPRDP